MASGYRKGWGRSPHQSILVSLADSHLWEKALFINRIFSKPHCHTAKHAFNKIPFLASLLFPSLPFGKGKVVFIMWTSTENYRWALVSAGTERCHWEGCATSYKEGNSEEWEVFPGLPFLVREDFICREAARQMSTLQWAFPHFSRNFLYVEFMNTELERTWSLQGRTRYMLCLMDSFLLVS